MTKTSVKDRGPRAAQLLAIETVSSGYKLGPY